MTAEFTLTSERKRKAEELLSAYPEKRAALLPILWLVQEQEGWVPPSAAGVVAELAGVAEAEVMEVASFYTMFIRKPACAAKAATARLRPIGRNHIQVCAGVCCRLRGSDWLLGYLKEKLGVGVNETTQDGEFHLSTVECLGSCGTAPMMQVGDDYYENLNAAMVDEILAALLHCKASL